MENNWTIEQTKALFDYVYQANASAKGLKWAFLKASEQSGRSINSVRNYYYSQLKMFELVPNLAVDLGVKILKTKRDGFELFTEDEINNLIKTILLGKAQGKSVRATIATIAKDSKEALRFQNKYRSFVAHNRPRMIAIMNELAAEGKVYYNPYLKQVMDSNQVGDNLVKLNDYISKLDAGEVGNFLSILGKLRL